jgi:hypothetical protein
MVLLLLMTILASCGCSLCVISEVQEKVKTFIRRAQREFGLPIKKV